MRARGIGFALAAGLLALGLLELASHGLHRLAYGEAFSYEAAQADRLRLVERQKLAEREGVAPPEGEPAALDEEMANNLQALHPYVGYVLDPDRSRQWHVNDYGFLGDAPPFGNEAPEVLSVALIGGSVAENTGIFAGEALLHELARIPAFQGRTLRLSLLALRGMKQPQQLLAIDWLLSLDARFDVVINLDGFNEIVLAGENALQGTNPFYPRRWRVRLQGIQGGDELADLGRIRFLERVRAGLAGRFSDSLLRFSVTANLVQRAADERIAAELEDARSSLNRRLLKAMGAPSYEARGPARPHEDDAARHRDLAAYWRRASVLLHERARSSGFRYFHFLQPNQWVAGSKPLTAAEREVAVPDDYFHRDTAAAGYPELIAAGRELARDGVDFTDLTPLFRDVEEQRYVDACCHLNTAGYEEVARAMARHIREAYAHDRRR